MATANLRLRCTTGQAYDFYQRQIAACDQRLQQLLVSLPTREMEIAVPAAQAERRLARQKKSSTKHKNVPPFDLQSELTRICGVDLTSIDGIDVMTAQTILCSN